ncbi:unnamed protein product, partial [Nesidiocoris tenuis]
MPRLRVTDMPACGLFSAKSLEKLNIVCISWKEIAPEESRTVEIARVNISSSQLLNFCEILFQSWPRLRRGRITKRNPSTTCTKTSRSELQSRSSSRSKNILRATDPPGRLSAARFCGRYGLRLLGCRLERQADHQRYYSADR